MRLKDLMILWASLYKNRSVISSFIEDMRKFEV